MFQLVIRRVIFNLTCLTFFVQYTYFDKTNSHESFLKVMRKIKYGILKTEIHKLGLVS